jgi:hypothetical protein
MRFRHVKVWPFVGENYKKEMPWGLRVMILGEAHYFKEPLYAGSTKDVVQDMLYKKPYQHWMNLFAKTVGVFRDGWSSRESRRSFWSSVVFYNFIQETVGDTPGIRPSEEMWQKAGPAFEEVLMEYKPGFVLVLGEDVWKHLPRCSEPGPMVVLPDGQTRESRLYLNDAGYAFTFRINHPSSPGGWSYKTWTPWVQAALRAAIEFQGAH